MLPEEDVKIESFRLAEGGNSLQLTHCPTGIVVFGDRSERPYLERLMDLHQKLELLVVDLHRRDTRR